MSFDILQSVLFALLTIGIVGAAAGVVLMKRITGSALLMAFAFLCNAGMFLLLGAETVAAFQVLIYVGAVMVFMVYVIMLLDPRDPALKTRFSSPLMVPGIIGGVLLAWALVHAVHGLLGSASSAPARFGLKEFSVSFLNEYWLHFELTSVLLLAAVVASLAVIKGASRRDRG